MKFHPPFPLTILVLSSLFWSPSCSDDALVDSSGLVLENEPIVLIPEPRPIAPGTEWIGTLSSFRIIFDERYLEDETLDFGLLYPRNSDTAYSGLIIRLRPNGTPEFSVNYKNGRAEGVARNWDDNGTLVKASFVKNGLRVEGKPAKATGTIDEISSKLKAYRENFDASRKVVFSGTNEMFDEFTKTSDGGAYLLEQQTGNLLTGGFKIYDTAGHLMTHSEYKDGMLHGRADSWHENGVKSIECSYMLGLKQGAESWWDDSGRKTMEANYSNGQYHGIETTWGEQGEVLHQYRYENGTKVETIYER